MQKKIYRANFLGPICILQIFGNNPSRGVWLYYQILMMSKMSKTEIYAKILNRKKIKICIIRITPKAFQLTARVRSFLKPNMKQINEAVQALACAIGFWRPSWKKNYQANSPGPVCILQIFGNNPSGGFRVRAETSGGGGRTQQVSTPPPQSGWRLNEKNDPHYHHVNFF